MVSITVSTPYKQLLTSTIGRDKGEPKQVLQICAHCYTLPLPCLVERLPYGRKYWRELNLAGCRLYEHTSNFKSTNNFVGGASWQRTCNMAMFRYFKRECH